MPNHVTSNIDIIGSDSQIAEVIEFMGTKENPFDFNKIAPIPKMLVGTKAPTSILSQADYDLQERIIVALNTKIANGEELTKEEQNRIDLGLSRGITKKMSEEAIEKYGADNWYDWQCDAWGTKWNSYEHWGLGEDSGGAFGFLTAWSHPMVIIEALSSKFNNVQFDVEFSDEDMGYNVGSYSMFDGEIVESNIPEGGSVDAYELAFKIQGGEYELYDVFEDFEESDSEDNDFFDACLNMSIKHESLDEMVHDWVLQKALDQCLSTENYEYAEKLKGFLALINKKG